MAKKDDVIAKKDAVIAEISGEYVNLKRPRGESQWVPHDTRDEVVDFVRVWAEKTELPRERFMRWIGVAKGKFYDWQKRYGKANEHTSYVPRDFWLAEEEKDAILEFHAKNPLEGYRRLTFMMLDQNVVAVSPATVYRVLSGIRG